MHSDLELNTSILMAVQVVAIFGCKPVPKCQCRLKICCSLLVSVCVCHTRLRREKYRFDFVLVGGTACYNPT